MGELVLRRRRDPRIGDETIYEVRLGEEFLMTSLFTRGEIALAELALEEAGTARPLDVVVGGLGLGYTAARALEQPNLGSLLVIELMPAVIDWHRRGLVPAAARLNADPRCRLIEGDFFAMAGPGGQGFDPARPGRCFDAILLDIDHSPAQVLAPGNAGLYQPSGLRCLAGYLQPGGVFALWSNDPPAEGFIQSLQACFASAWARVVRFPNPYTGRDAANTVYLARTGTGRRHD